MMNEGGRKGRGGLNGTRISKELERRQSLGTCLGTRGVSDGNGTAIATIDLDVVRAVVLQQGADVGLGVGLGGEHISGDACCDASLDGIGLDVVDRHGEKLLTIGVALGLLGVDLGLVVEGRFRVTKLSQESEFREDQKTMVLHSDRWIESRSKG